MVPMSSHQVGTLLIIAGLTVAVGGFRLARRYSAAANDTSIGRKYPLHHGWLGVLGGFLVILGLSMALVGWMVGFA